MYYSKYYCLQLFLFGVIFCGLSAGYANFAEAESAALYTRGIHSFQRKNYKKAIRSFEILLLKDPIFANAEAARVYLVQSLVANKQKDKALKQIELFLQNPKESKNIESWLNLRDSIEKSKQTSKFISSFFIGCSAAYFFVLNMAVMDAIMESRLAFLNHGMYQLGGQLGAFQTEMHRFGGLLITRLGLHR